jgi:hypothetical protein
MEHLKGASLGEATGLPANIRLGWKGMSGTNTLPYYEKSIDYEPKFFYNIVPR